MDRETFDEIWGNLAPYFGDSWDYYYDDIELLDLLSGWYRNPVIVDIYNRGIRLATEYNRLQRSVRNYFLR